MWSLKRPTYAIIAGHGVEEKEVVEEEEVIPKGSKVLRENLCGLSLIESRVESEEILLLFFHLPLSE